MFSVLFLKQEKEKCLNFIVEKCKNMKNLYVDFFVTSNKTKMDNKRRELGAHLSLNLLTPTHLNATLVTKLQ